MHPFLRFALLCALSTPAAAAEQTVDIRLFMFQPSELTVPAGTRVVWRNTDAIEHR